MKSIILISRAAIFAFVLAAVLSFTEVIDPTIDPNDNVRRLGFLLAGAAFSLMALTVWLVRKYKAHLVKPVLLGMTILYLPIFSANTLIAWQDSLDPELKQIEHRVEAAAALGLSFDKRKYVDALLDIRAEGKSIFQNTSPKEFVSGDYCESALVVNGVKTVPMGALASTPTLISNELGTSPIWMTDRYGFNNPDSVWDDNSVLDSIIIGDSFAAGYSVEQGEEISGQLRNLDHKSVNLASFGSGPITALAQLREYGSSMSTNYVFWIFFHGNDFYELNNELIHPVMNRYIDPTFSQNLRANSPSIDPVYRKYASKVLATLGKTRDGPGCAEFMQVTNLRRRIGGFVSLITLKNSAAKIVSSMKTPPIVSGNISEFKSIAKLIDDEARQGGAQLVFVFLPQYFDLHKYFEPEEFDPLVSKDKVLETIRNVGIPIIDIQETRDAHSDPASFYPLRIFGHMSPFGYQHVATELQQYANNNPR